MSYRFKKGGARGCSGIHLVITIIADLAALAQGVVPRAARAGTVHAPVQAVDARAASIAGRALFPTSGRARARASDLTSAARRAGVTAPRPRTGRHRHHAARRGTRTTRGTPQRRQVKLTQFTRRTRDRQLVSTPSGHHTFGAVERMCGYRLQHCRARSTSCNRRPTL